MYIYGYVSVPTVPSFFRTIAPCSMLRVVQAAVCAWKIRSFCAYRPTCTRVLPTCSCKLQSADQLSNGEQDIIEKHNI